MILDEAGKRYGLRWQDGAIAGADSPAPTDAVARIAFAEGLANRSQVGDMLRKLAADETLDQLAVLADVAKLKPEEIAALRQRHFARQAVRPFALRDATLTLDDEPTIDATPGVEPLDVRWLIHKGLLIHYDEKRLDAELAVLGDRWFCLRDDVEAKLAAFRFNETERACLDHLRAPTHLVKYIADSALGRKRALALLYALLGAEYVHAVEASRPVPTRTTAGVPTPQAAPAPTAAPKPAPAAAPKPASTAAAPTPAHQAAASRKTFGAVKQRQSSGPKVTSEDVRALVAEKADLLDAHADLFALLGVGRDCTAEELRLSYFNLAKHLHPDRLRALGMRDLEQRAQQVFAEINRGFAILTDAHKRNDYLETLSAGGERAVAQQQREAEELAARLVGAEEAFMLGTIALRRNGFAEANRQFGKAVELNPEEAEHQAMYAWTLWASTEDKAAVHKQVRKALRKALSLQPKCVLAYYYRGKIAAAEGKNDTARECFTRVLELEPGHQGAATEVRLMDARKAKAEKTGGLFGRRKS